MVRLLSKTDWVLAAQWDSESLQYVLAKRNGTDLNVVSARCLEHTGENDYITELLNAELKKHAAHRPDVVVALNRSQVDLFPLELPPAADDELASLVALQATQHVSDNADNAMLDFLPLGNCSANDAPYSRNVLAVAPQSQAIDAVRELLASVDLAKLVRIGLRPLASLTFAQSMIAEPPSKQTSPALTADRTLFITLHDQQADLLLLDGLELRLSRSIRLPSRDDPGFVENLMSEIRRTEMVAPADIDDDTNMEQSSSVSTSSINQILACGGIDEEAIWHSLEQLAGIRVHLISPLEYLPSDHKIVARESGRFAPLVGLLLEHTGDRSTVNFLDPRRPAVAPGFLRRFGVYVAAAMLALAMLGYFAFEQRTAVDAELETLSTQFAQAEELAAKLQRRERIASAVEQWQADDVSCLDELRDLSQRFPTQKDAYVQRMVIAPTQVGAKTVTLQVRVRDPSLVSMMESNLRDSHHRIVSKRVTEFSAEDEFGWQFDATILVTPRDASSYRLAFQSESVPESGKSPE